MKTVYILLVHNLSNNKKILECRENEIDIHLSKYKNYYLETIEKTKKDCNKYYNQYFK